MGDPMSRAETAEVLGISVEEVAEIEQQAMKKMRRYAAAHPEVREAFEAFLRYHDAEPAVATPVLKLFKLVESNQVGFNPAAMVDYGLRSESEGLD
ncbi:MAG: hypothetical protein KGL39_54245 [Patescibacteria group bacterium]|nr:hypothetical protein [Patescibacteria group bacterium]